MATRKRRTKTAGDRVRGMAARLRATHTQLIEQRAVIAGLRVQLEETRRYAKDFELRTIDAAAVLRQGKRGHVRGEPIAVGWVDRALQILETGECTR